MIFQLSCNLVFPWSIVNEIDILGSNSFNLKTVKTTMNDIRNK